MLRKGGRPQELSYRRMPEHQQGCRMSRHRNCHFHQHHYYYSGFQVVVLTTLSVSEKHPVCRLFSDMCADQAFLPHTPVFLFSDRERSPFCLSSMHSPPTPFSLSVRPWHPGISPCV